MIGRATRRRSAVAPLALWVIISACSGDVVRSPPTTSGSASSEPIVATGVALAAPEDVAFDASGTLYISEFEGNRIDRIDDASSVHRGPHVVSVRQVEETHAFHEERPLL